MALDTTEGGASAEAFASLSYADIYFSKRGNPDDWNDASTAARESAIRYGADYMNSQFTWKSKILSVTQALPWPREAYYDSEGRTIAAVVPDKIKDANCEFALSYLRGEIFSVDLEGIASESVGASSVTYSGSGNKTHSALKVSLREYGSGGRSNVSELFRA